jgi:ATP-dependent DNA helicase RecG
VAEAARKATPPAGAPALATWLEEADALPTLDPDHRARFLALGMRLTRVHAAALAPASAPAPAPAPEAPAAADPDALTSLHGCGPRTAERLATRGLRTVRDLLAFLPRQYEDRRRRVPVAEVVPGTPTCVAGVVSRTRWLGRPGRRFFEVELRDGDAVLLLRWFRTHGGLAARFAPGVRVAAAGTAKAYQGRLQLVHPSIEILPEVDGDDLPDEGPGLVPRYGLVEGVPAGLVRRLVAEAVDRLDVLVEDLLPPELAAACGLPGRREALAAAHRPPDDLDAAALADLVARRSPAHRRLAFDVLLLQQFVMATRRQSVADRGAPAFAVPAGWPAPVEAVLPFALTAAQRRVVDEIAADLARPRPMQRLLQGDVGAGKTAVAFAAAAQVLLGGGQVAVMAPTEILAEQHQAVLDGWARALGFRSTLLTAATPRGARESILALLLAGELPLLVGTHALLGERVDFARLGLVVVDEQHRFGVAQRARLRAKGETEAEAPHVLVMTATPIPRTLALTVYADLDLSVLDALPPGRIAPETHVVAAAKREALYRRVAAQLAAGKRAFVVCPLVAGSEALPDTADAERTYADLAERLAPHRVGLLHGRLAPDEKAAALGAFRRGELAALVATTVVEVGVDVPDAELMIVESAERFGLAQLHQLRGRVGRAAGQAARCVLLVGPGASAEARERLAVLKSAADGFAIAEADLEQRGPGELLGVRQAGEPDPILSVAVAHPDLLAAARTLARDLASGSAWPGVADALRRAAADRFVDRVFGEESG